MNAAADVVNLFLWSSVIGYGVRCGWSLALKASPMHAAVGLVGVGLLALFEV